MNQTTRDERAYARALAKASKADQLFSMADQHFRDKPSVSTWLKRQASQLAMFRAHQRVLDARKEWAKQIDKTLKDEVLRYEKF